MSSLKLKPCVSPPMKQECEEAKELRVLDGKIDKRYFLDMMAYLLCDQSFAYELGHSHVNLCLKLYKEVLAELKNQLEQDLTIAGGLDDFAMISLECRELADLFCMEKKLELIEERVPTVKHYQSLSTG